MRTYVLKYNYKFYGGITLDKNTESLETIKVLGSLKRKDKNQFKLIKELLKELNKKDRAV